MSESGLPVNVGSNERLGVSDNMRARTLIALLWRKYDAAGMSMGRSHEAVLLEAAMDLLGPPDADDIERCEHWGGGDVVDETRTYLSKRKARALGFLTPNV